MKCLVPLSQEGTYDIAKRQTHRHSLRMHPLRDRRSVFDDWLSSWRKTDV